MKKDTFTFSWYWYPLCLSSEWFVYMFEWCPQCALGSAEGISGDVVEEASAVFVVSCFGDELFASGLGLFSDQQHQLHLHPLAHALEYGGHQGAAITGQQLFLVPCRVLPDVGQLMNEGSDEGIARRAVFNIEPIYSMAVSDCDAEHSAAVASAWHEALAQLAVQGIGIDHLQLDGCSDPHAEESFIILDGDIVDMSELLYGMHGCPAAFRAALTSVREHLIIHISEAAGTEITAMRIIRIEIIPFGRMDVLPGLLQNVVVKAERLQIRPCLFQIQTGQHLLPAKQQIV